MPFVNPIVIQEDLLSAISCPKDDQATFSEVMLSRLDIVSQWLVNAEVATESLTSSIMSEFEDIFASLDLEPHDSPTQTSVVVVSPTQWLLDNLHNPYPSGAVKRAMEESPELGSRTVNEWFARARQRIGWTRLLRDRFSGSRCAATDAAFRALVRDDPRSPLDPELRAAFVAVRAHANLVYAPPSPAILEIARNPSPPYRSLSATPSLTHSTDSEDSDDDASQTSRKRKRSRSDLPSDPHPVSPPPRKRRLAPSSPQTPHPLSPLSTSVQIPSFPSPPRSRKRRLSEADSDEHAVKKPRGLDWVPKKQTVSDPLPHPTPLVDWDSQYNGIFALPPSATTDHPVPDALDFELFNFAAFLASQPTSKSETHGLPSPHNDLPRPSDTADLPANSCPNLPEQRDACADPPSAAPGQNEEEPCSASWEDFFSFELPFHSSSPPSLTNSPSSPNPTRSLSPPEPPYFDLLEPPLYYFSSPSLFKIPTSLYPAADGVEIVDNSFNSL